jgi:hypothetical protein
VQTKLVLAIVFAVALGIQGRVVVSPGPNLQVWSKTLTGINTRAVALFNRGGSPASITVQWSDSGLPAGAARDGARPLEPHGPWQLRPELHCEQRRVPRCGHAARDQRALTPSTWRTTP